MSVVFRDYKATIPPEVTYGSIERGQELSRTLNPLCDLASRWYDSSGKNDKE